MKSRALKISSVSRSMPVRKKWSGSTENLLEALNLTYTQYLVMMVLWEHGGMTEGQLGRKVYLDSGTLAPLLKRMERSGLINRIKPDGNVRKLYVTLTQEGRDLKEKAKSVPGEIQNCLPLPREDLLVLRELLNHLLVSMEKNMQETR